MDFVRRWSEKAEIGAGRFIGWLDITASSSPACLNTRHTLVGLTATMSASSVEVEWQAIEEGYGL